MTQRLIASKYSETFWLEALMRSAQEQERYHIYGIYHYKIKPDLERLQLALQTLVNNQYNLRSYFREEGGVLVQHIQDVVPVTLHYREAKNQQEYQNILDESIAEPFDLRNGPLFRFIIIINKVDAKFTFVPIFHHIIIDGTQFQNLMSNITRYYEKPELTSSDNDQIADLKRYLDHERDLIDQAHASYWIKKLDGFNLYTALPTKKNLDSSKVKDNYKQYQLDALLYADLIELSKKTNTTIFHILKTCLALLMCQYSNQNKVVIGYPFNTRPHNYKHVKGAFINTSLYAFEKKGSFIDCLEMQKDELYKQHRYVPIFEILSTLNRKGDCFSVSISQSDLLTKGPKLGEIPEYTFRIASGANSLYFVYNNNNECLNYALIGRSNVFAESDLDRLATRFTTLLSNIVREPNKSTQELSCLNGSECDILLQRNRKVKPAASNLTISKLFEIQAEKSPDEIALVYGKQKLTYQELNETANHLARYIRTIHRKLLQTKLVANTIIPICLEVDIDMIIAILAVLKAGGAYLSIAPNCPDKLVQHLLDEISPAMLLTVQDFVDRIQHLNTSRSEAIILDELFYFTAPIINLRNYSSSKDLACVLYKYNKSGNPHGILIEHQALINTISAINSSYQIAPKTKIALFPHPTYGLPVAEVFVALLNGGELHLSQRAITENPIQIAKYLIINDIETTNLSIKILSSLPQIEYPALKRVINCSEESNLKVESYWLDQLDIYNYFGMPETGFYTIEGKILNSNCHIMGKPLKNTYAYVLNSDRQLSPIGIDGKLYVSGLGLARGYLNNKHLDKQLFLENTLTSSKNNYSERMYNTEQPARWLSDGNLELMTQKGNEEEYSSRHYLLNTTVEFSHIETAIAEIWSELLESDAPLDFDATFFELGANSLLTVKIRTKLEEAFNVKLNITDIFEHNTIKKLAEHIDSVCNQKSQHKSDANSLSCEDKNHDVIAVVGMSCRVPGAKNIEEFWQLLLRNESSIRHYTKEELRSFEQEEQRINNPKFVSRGAVLEDYYKFDAQFFNYSSKEAELLDPQQRLFLECAWEALEHSGNIPIKFSGEIGVFASQGSSLYNAGSSAVSFDSLESYQSMLNSDKDFLASKVSYKLNLTGPSINVQTGCSSSLVAIQLACDSLKNNNCDLVLAGGVFLYYQPGYLHQEGMIFSPDGYVKTFDAHASGTVAGSGVGVVVLKRLADALEDRDTIYAVIRGGALNNDGSDKIGYTAPGLRGQVNLIKKALINASVAAHEIDYVETHGTGTPLGDPIEWSALHKAYENSPEREHRCMLGALKTNIGHTDCAAGVLGFIKTVLALDRKVIPATLNFTTLNPEISCFNKLFEVVASNFDWTKQTSKRRAAISSFGIGGSNAHIILEEYARTTKPKQSDVYLIPISAKNNEALITLASNTSTALENPCLELGDFAFTAQEGREEYKKRGYFIVQNKERIDIRKTVIREQEIASTTTPIIILDDTISRDDLLNFIELSESYSNFKLCLQATINEISDNNKCDLDLTPDIDCNRLRLMKFIIQYSLINFFIEIGIKPKALIPIGSGTWVAAACLGVLTIQEIADKLLSDSSQLISLQKEINNEIAIISPYTSRFAIAQDFKQVSFWQELLRSKDISTGKMALSMDEIVICLGSAKTLNIGNDYKVNKINDRLSLLTAVGNFWLHGGRVAWHTLRSDNYPYNKTAFPTYPFTKTYFRKTSFNTDFSSKSIPTSGDLDTNRRLKQLWSSVLGISPNNIQNESHFLDFGDSMGAIELLDEINKAFNRELEFKQMANNYQFSKMLALLQQGEIDK